MTDALNQVTKLRDALEAVTLLRSAIQKHQECDFNSDHPALAAALRDTAALTADASDQAPDERAAFEAWYAPRHDAVDFLQRDDGQYDDWDIALQWNAWQARAARPAPVDEAPAAEAIPKRRWSKEAEMVASWQKAQAVDMSIPAAKIDASGECVDAVKVAEPVTDRMTEFKTDSVMQRGYRKVGYVLQMPGGDYAISSQSAVRWLDQKQMFRLMHEQNGSLFAAPDRAPSKPQELSSVAPEVSNQAPEVGRAPSTDYSGCCETPHLCSAVRRCTAKDGAPSTDSATAPRFDETEFAEMVKLGTAAWKDVPGDLLEKLRGNVPDSATERDAARYRWLIEQIPCSIADDLECGIGEIGDEIDDAIVSSEGLRQSFIAAMKGEGQ